MPNHRQRGHVVVQARDLALEFWYRIHTCVWHVPSAPGLSPETRKENPCIASFHWGFTWGVAGAHLKMLQMH